MRLVWTDDESSVRLWMRGGKENASRTIAPAVKIMSSCRLKSCSRSGIVALPPEKSGRAAGSTMSVRNRTCNAVTQRDTAHPHRVNLRGMFDHPVEMRRVLDGSREVSARMRPRRLLSRSTRATSFISHRHK